MACKTGGGSGTGTGTAACGNYFTNFMDYLEKDVPLISTFIQHMNHDKDPRVEGWLFMSSGLYPVAIALVYLLSLLICSIVYKNHGLDQLNVFKVLNYYNIVLVCLNLALGTMLGYEIMTAKYSLLCQPVSRNTSGVEMKIAYLVYAFHISKIIELSDTFFHIARHKPEQMTFLHLYHHSSMVIATWIGVRYVPGGSAAIIAMVNSWVHVLMYIYYELSMGAKNRYVNQFMNYKMFVTLMQITQFCFTIGVCCSVLLKGCQFPAWVAITLSFYMLGFIVLFVNFVCRMYL